MLTIKIVQIVEGATLPGKLAGAELHFTASPGDRVGVDADSVLAGLKLVGFTIWESRAGGRNVTFPARSYSVNGERRSFALLRPAESSAEGQDRLRALILEAYAEYEAKAGA